MINVIYGDIRCAVFCCLLGFLLKALYDVVKIIYKVNKSGKYSRWTGDSIFFMCSALAVFQIMLEKYNGLVRGYVLFFMGVGALLHRKIICDSFVNLISGIIFYIDSKIVRKVIGVFVKNIKKIDLVKYTCGKVLKIYHRCSKMSLRPILKRSSDT